MSVPPLPSGYDVTKHVHGGRSDCHVTVGFDQSEGGHIPRFLVQLYHQIAQDPIQWRVIARMDHNETSMSGHDVYQEGLHVDIARKTSRGVHLPVRHGPLPTSRGAVIRGCVQYLKAETEYLIDVYEERRPPGRPPGWAPDGGESGRRFIRPNALESDMSREAPADADEILTDEELTELLADVEGKSPEEIERAAEEIEIETPEDAEAEWELLDEDFEDTSTKQDS